MPGPLLPRPLAGLLGRMGLGARGPGSDGPGGMRGEGMRAGDGGGAEPTAELGPEGLLAAGLGYAGADRHTRLRNRVEQANLSRFLAALEGEDTAGPPRDRAGADHPDGDAPREARAERKGVDRERHEAREPTRRDEGGERAKGEDVIREPHAEGWLGHEARSEEERSAQERDPGGGEGGGSGEEPEDEEERPGGGWLAEELEERESRRRFRLEGADPLGASTRCRGHLEDGTRCLRKPIEGTPFCREHRYG